MNKNRLEAFSDGVMAIIITIMVLELKTPHGTTIAALVPLIPVLMSYLLSFIYVGIYWNNHHHMMQLVKKVNGKALWANLHLLFWLSLFPFATAWMGENHYESWPVIIYGCVVFMASVAYFILERTLVRLHGADSVIAQTYGLDIKGKVSSAIYIVSIAGSFMSSWIGIAGYVLVAIIWFVPDTRVEKRLQKEEPE
ncbi:MAG: TMEM175 family protein [Candidatus Pedobacter colombiensis]|uniref:TMEM175 family protein n=1 Tax=Candidatus Pedobacter colombiensis TaxID=3121371 RepID=A0AAJ5W7F9_9SPHI|nr:TMEM175 family protein [Pedobacter sp.]WEK19943.1 MAG: TMEM175 family protein [Pedobacter sp.]